MRALSSVDRATLVTIEPSTEDDWEVMELNSELAEAAILNQVVDSCSIGGCYVLCVFRFVMLYVSEMQVRIVHEGMKFPLWLHGRTTVTFLVVSTFPKKSVGKMLHSRLISVNCL